MAKKGNFWRILRLSLLVYLLLFVAVGSWLSRSRSTDWNDTLYVGVYPINGDSSSVADNYIQSISAASFADIERFVAREAKRYRVSVNRPVQIEFGIAPRSAPPLPPENRNPLLVLVWSLKLRFWAWRDVGHQPGPRPDIRMYVVYYDPEQNPVLNHSLGLRKGLIGIVQAFATNSMLGSNNVVFAHELLHTLGATDKYDPGSTHPAFPAGYADPDQRPLHPQKFAEIMGGRRAIAETQAQIPDNLRQVVVGTITATEIRWLP